MIVLYRVGLSCVMVGFHTPNEVGHIIVTWVPNPYPP